MNKGRTCRYSDCASNDANLISRFFGGFNVKDDVNRPEHYKSENGLEVIEVIEAFELDFNLGNAIKYILRAGKKDDESQDLRKAVWYLRREINKLEEREEEDE